MDPKDPMDPPDVDVVHDIDVINGRRCARLGFSRDGFDTEVLVFTATGTSHQYETLRTV
jgi:hypothetical protein